MKSRTVVNPPVIVELDQNGRPQYILHPPQGWGHQHYGLLVCDLVRHVAACFSVPEQMVWNWVEKERDRPTSDVLVLKSLDTDPA
jgi:hypothetical protein